MNFDWNQARAFLVTAETGSFSAAARALGQTQPTLGRQVAGLEETLSVVLFERIGRKLELTPAGQDLLEHLRIMGDAATRLSITASGRSEEISGEVCISVTDIFAAYVMPKLTAELLQKAPQLRIRVLASNELSDLQRHEADIAVRHVRPTQPDLIAKKVRDARGCLMAAQSFVDRAGPFECLEDLHGADFIGMGDETEMISFLEKWGIEVGYENFRVTSKSGVAAWEMLRAGLGILPMLDDLGGLCPDVVPVLPELSPVEVPYWLTTHRELHTSKRIRLVFDYLAEALARPNIFAVSHRP